MVRYNMFVFFFSSRRRHTRYWRDWSSDVCSSDLPWAIPWEVVQCESGGQNFPPNHAGASGYYQIIPETWKRHGGSGPAAHLAPKAEQDRVAARIWKTDGPDSWVCHGLVN